MIKLILFLNKFFKKREHPWNREGEYKLNYADFEYESAPRVFKDFEDALKINIKDLIQDKKVLDLGSGAGGKSIFLKENGASEVFGIDLSQELIDQAISFSNKKGVSNLNFEVGDVTNIPYLDNSFDIVIANDLMEHVSSPEKCLSEAFRVLKSNGIFLINFEPYYHFLGHHMWDVLNIPWAHVFFGEKTRIAVYKELVKNLLDGLERYNFRVSKRENGEEYIGYLNHLTFYKFKKILKISGFRIERAKILPLPKFPFKFLSKIPFVQEFCILRLVFILKK